MILIDYKDRRPIYEQVIERFQQMILCGVLKANEPMPSVRSLAMELSINPNTIQRVYQELERQGYIYTMKGKGSFVCDTKGIAEMKRAEIKKEFSSYIEKIMETGFSEEELRELFEEALRVKNGK